MLGLFLARAGVEVVVLVRTRSRVSGVHATTDAGPLRVDVALIVAADDRGSTLRDAVGMAPVAAGFGIDVLWFRVPESATSVPDTLAWLSGSGMLITIPRPGYFQCVLVVGKGSFGAIREDDIDAFRTRVAAHAMAPAFGVGVNYAIQDAVAAARCSAAEPCPLVRCSGSSRSCTVRSDARAPASCTIRRGAESGSCCGSRSRSRDVCCRAWSGTDSGTSASGRAMALRWLRE
jgi:hypothetical protein